MPTLRIFEGSEPTRDPSEGLLFDRLPCSLRQDPRLCSGAKVQLGSIIPKGGPWPDYVERTDEWVQEETGFSRATIQNHWRELEDTGWVKRVRRRGHRRIYLLFDLAGRMQSQLSGHAITENWQCAPRILCMQSQESGRPSIRERERKIPSGEGASPSATSPQGTGSPTTTPTQTQKQTQACIQADDPATWDEATAREWQAIADDPNQPFRKLAAKRMAEYHHARERRAEEESQATGKPAKVVRSPGFEGQEPCQE